MKKPSAPRGFVGKLRAFPARAAGVIPHFMHFVGDASWPVRASMLVMGLGQLMYGQVVKGLLFLSVLVCGIWYFATQGITDIIGFFTLGTTPGNQWTGVAGDNSMTMLILGLFAFVLLAFLLVLYVVNVKDAAYTQNHRVRKGLKPYAFKETLAHAVDERFHITALSLPMVTVSILSVLPIVFMILLAFTNFSNEIMYPRLADWSLAGWEKLASVGNIAQTFGKILSWNVIWAVSTTTLNYFAGLGLALLLNSKVVRGAKVWRAFPMLAYAIPGFITMLGFKHMFSQGGPINQMIVENGGNAIFFLINDPSAKWWARGIGLFVNCWITTPSMMLLITGILSNMNADLYEAAALDGASKFQQFKKITLPFVIFSTTPMLISQFVGNFNNFGIFFFLRGGTYSSGYFNASDTDLLINWLYNLTVSNNYYAIGAVISLLIFFFTSTISLIVYVNSAAYKKEDMFQ